MADLVESEVLSGPAWGAIKDAARTVGTHTVRNRATVGGNIFSAHFPSDLPTVFLALGASVTLQGADGPATSISMTSTRSGPKCTNVAT